MFFDRVDRDDIRVRHARDKLRFTKKSLPQCGLRHELRWQHLERHQSVERALTSEIHDAHAATPKLTLDRVTTGDHGAQCPEFLASVRNYGFRHSELGGVD